MYRRFLVLVGLVNEDVEVISGFGGDGDKLLIPIEIIHQSGVALGVTGTPSGSMPSVTCSSASSGAEAVSGTGSGLGP